MSGESEIPKTFSELVAAAWKKKRKISRKFEAIFPWAHRNIYAAAATTSDVKFRHPNTHGTLDIFQQQSNIFPIHTQHFTVYLSSHPIRNQGQKIEKKRL